MKIIKFLFIINVVFSFLSAQGIDESLIDKVKKVSGDLLEGYSQPLVTTFGTAMGTGLFHSAYSHDLLGFDLGLRIMVIPIPSTAKYFSGTALACSLDSNGDLVSFDVQMDSMSTIFGPEENTYVPAPGLAVGIPRYVPGGYDLGVVGFFMPQLNIGLPIGLELGIRYLPIAVTYPFTTEGTGISLYFFGIGGKLCINKLPFMKDVPIPISVALGGFYQIARVKDNEGNNVINTDTWNLQFLISKRLIVFEPIIGFGLEGTDVNFRYDFEYIIPDTINNEPTEYLTEHSYVDLSFHSQNHYRAFIGFTFYFGPIYFHYDYNITPYKIHNGIIGITIR